MLAEIKMDSHSEVDPAQRGQLLFNLPRPEALAEWIA